MLARLTAPVRAWLTIQWERRQSVESYRLGIQRIVREAWKSAVREARGYRRLEESPRYSAIGCLLLIGLFAQPTNIYRIDRAGQGTEHVPWSAAFAASERDRYLADGLDIQVPQRISGGSGAVYYVSTVGIDTNDGLTTSSPFRTIGHGLSVVGAGTLYVRNGTYDEYVDGSPSSGTSWLSTVRVANYPSETVWLAPTSSPYMVVWLRNGEHYIDFDGINMDGTLVPYGTFVTGEGAPTPLPHHIRVQHAEIIGPTSDVGGPILLGSHYVQGTPGGHQLRDLTIHHGSARSVPAGDGNPHGNYGIYCSGPNNLIEYCDIYDVASMGIHVYNGGGDPADNNIIRNNHIHGLSRSLTDNGNGIFIAGSNNTVENNLIEGLGFTNGRAGIVVYGAGSSNNKIWHNTVANNTMAGIWIDTSVPGTEVRNNISFNNAEGNYVDLGSGTVHLNNLDDGTNPIFVNAGGGNFHLQAGSPAIDYCPLLPSVLFDFDGGARPIGALADAGCYEYGSTPTGGTDTGGDPIAPPPPGEPPPTPAPPPEELPPPAEPGTVIATSTNELLPAPAGADGVSIAPSGSSWGNSTPVQVIASTATAIAHAGIVVHPPNSGAADWQWEIDVMIGAAASEVKVGTYKGGNFHVSSVYDDASAFALPIPSSVIPISSRVSLRLRKNGTDTTAWKATLQYYELPVVGSMQITTAELKCAPSAANCIVIATAQAWGTPGSFTTLIASAPAGLALVGLCVLPQNNSVGAYELHIATGAAASETVKFRKPGFVASYPAAPHMGAIVHPNIAIATGQRVSAQASCAGAFAGTSALAIGLMYYELPL